MIFQKVIIIIFNLYYINTSICPVYARIANGCRIPSLSFSFHRFKNEIKRFFVERNTTVWHDERYRFSHPNIQVRLWRRMWIRNIKLWKKFQVKIIFSKKNLVIFLKKKRAKIMSIQIACKHIRRRRTLWNFWRNGTNKFWTKKIYVRNLVTCVTKACRYRI